MRFNLSEITDLIRERRTIRPENYSARKVHKEQIELILNNAIWAPTHGKTQPWRFQVFQEEAKERLGQFLGELYLSEIPKEEQVDIKLSKMITRPKQSSVVIAVCMERQPEEKIPEIEEVEAVACAIQNMSLTATAYGLGNFWWSPKIIYSQKMNEFLEIGEKDKCLGLFCLGYPEGEWPKGQRKPIEYITKWMEK